jgi:hypothetical protein
LELEDEENLDTWISHAEDIDLSFFEKYKSDLATSTVNAQGVNLALHKEILVEAGLQEAREHKQLLQAQSESVDDQSNQVAESLHEIDLSPAARREDNHYDERMRADFNVWTNASRLSWQELKQSYVGLFDSLLNATNPSYSCVCVMECVLRPDAELKRIMAIALRASHNLDCKFQLLKRSQAIIHAASPTPDNRATHSQYRLSSALSPTSAMNARPVNEWDVLEVQVCISRELKQRVLVGIYLKRNNSSVSLSSPKITNMSLVPMHKMTNKIRKLLISSKLCLSSLYQVPPAMVCESGRLDGHFVAQVQTLFRESMWSSLHEAFIAMDEYAKTTSRSALIAQQSMEAIYKQHDIEITSLNDQLQQQQNQSNSSATAVDEMKIESAESSMKLIPAHDRDEEEFTDGMAKCLKIATIHFQSLQSRYEMSSSYCAAVDRKTIMM